MAAEISEVIILYASYPRAQSEHRYTVIVQLASIDVVVVTPIPLSAFLAHYKLKRGSEDSRNITFTVRWAVSIAILPAEPARFDSGERRGRGYKKYVSRPRRILSVSSLISLSSQGTPDERVVCATDTTP